MVKKVFTVYDSKAEVYLPPFFSNTNGSAIREIQDGMKQENSILNVHKNDLSLFEIGTYDDNTADLIGLTPKICLGTLNDLDPSKESNNK